jgi:lysophospholipase L1-like esterase
VSRAGRARQIAMGAAYSGGGATLLGASAVGLLLAQARQARRTIGRPTSEPPHASGRYGDAGVNVPPVRLVLLGDSSAAGLGVHRSEETPAVVLACGLAEATGRQVEVTTVALSGAESRDLDRQVPLALGTSPQVAVIMIGANDVTHRIPQRESVSALATACRRLREAGCEVVVGTCPDLGTVEPIPHPLRWLARRWSRQLAAAQTIAVVEAGGRSVSLGDILGPEFAAKPSEMFGPDRFHPSAAGYAAAASVLLPAVCAAAGLPEPAVPRPAGAAEESVLPVAEAAVEAAEAAGTQVEALSIPSQTHERTTESGRGTRGRWALLRRRRSTHRPADPEPEGSDGMGAAAESADGQLTPA